jgi:hypothetical protein
MAFSKGEHSLMVTILPEAEALMLHKEGIVSDLSVSIKEYECLRWQGA